jgi:hypothetical protein
MGKREAIADDLRALADDLKSLIETATTDPKERQRKERRWSVLYGALGLATTMVSRRLAVKLWGILTGEEAPLRRPPSSPARREERQPVGEAAEARDDQAETISSSSSSVK